MTKASTDRLVCRKLRGLLPKLRARELLFAGSERELRGFVGRLCLAARLPGLPWRPYSLRRGGATADLNTGGSLYATAVRGLWQSARAARLYIDDAVATLAKIRGVAPRGLQS